MARLHAAEFSIFSANIVERPIISWMDVTYSRSDLISTPSSPGPIPRYIPLSFDLEKKPGSIKLGGGYMVLRALCHNKHKGRKRKGRLYTRWSVAEARTYISAHGVHLRQNLRTRMCLKTRTQNFLAIGRFPQHPNNKIPCDVLKIFSFNLI